METSSSVGSVISPKESATQFPARLCWCMTDPLDVSVFKGFKHEVRKLLRRVQKASADCKVSKNETAAIASRAYQAKLMTNKKAITNGFCTCGIFPLSLPSMIARLSNSNNGGIVRGELGLANWLRVREEARQQVLTLPPSPARKKGSRKTADASQQILRKRDLQITPPREKKQKTSNRAEAAPRASDSNDNQVPAVEPLFIIESVTV
ncbi:hypothetical protein PR003_g14455 [Phytophthora rubi]|uniref:Uncharacterized protein n=1 Tax=Phytophthora rubi TaxID=129364 RepID=A0A6A4F447_9STRA|nr:hypothetical protein PR003_g14455 [Phytophthora rubi]